MTADRDDLAAITNAIEELAWESPFFEKGEPREFAQVVALMVLESDWLRGVKAEAWGQGVQYMAERCVDEHDISATYRLGDNPYRADRVDAEDGEN